MHGQQNVKNTNKDLDFKVYTVNRLRVGLASAHISGREQERCHLLFVQSISVATQLPIQWDLGSFPVIKLPESDAEQ